MSKIFREKFFIRSIIYYYNLMFYEAFPNYGKRRKVKIRSDNHVSITYVHQKLLSPLVIINPI